MCFLDEHSKTWVRDKSRKGTRMTALSSSWQDIEPPASVPYHLTAPSIVEHNDNKLKDSEVQRGTKECEHGAQESEHNEPEIYDFGKHVHFPNVLLISNYKSVPSHGRLSANLSYSSLKAQKRHFCQLLFVSASLHYSISTDDRVVSTHKPRVPRRASSLSQGDPRNL